MMDSGKEMDVCNGVLIVGAPLPGTPRSGISLLAEKACGTDFCCSASCVVIRLVDTMCLHVCLFASITLSWVGPTRTIPA